MEGRESPEPDVIPETSFPTRRIRRPRARRILWSFTMSRGLREAGECECGAHGRTDASPRRACSCSRLPLTAISHHTVPMGPSDRPSRCCMIGRLTGHPGMVTHPRPSWRVHVPKASPRSAIEPRGRGRAWCRFRYLLRTHGAASAGHGVLSSRQDVHSGDIGGLLPCARRMRLCL